MKNILLTSLFTGLLLSANFSMANSKVEIEQVASTSNVIEGMIQSKLETQLMHYASAEKTDDKKSGLSNPGELGFDSYTFR